MEVLRLNSPSAGYRNSRRSLCSRGSANTSPLCCCLGKRDEDLEFGIAALGKELLKPSLTPFNRTKNSCTYLFGAQSSKAFG